jgi:predicted phosphoribosyltransferase
MHFADRRDAGRRLAGLLERLVDDDVVVLGLPRGGVPVAFEIALALSAPLDVIVVRKLGAPHQPELAMGAIGEDGVRVVDDGVVRSVGATDAEIAAIEVRERAELARRARQFRGDVAPVAIKGRTAVIVDDGIATGSSARVACRIVRARGASRLVLAVPVAPERWTRELRGEADEFVCVSAPRWYRSVGEWYRDFSQTTDEEVNRCLALGRR